MEGQATRKGILPVMAMPLTTHAAPTDKPSWDTVTLPKCLGAVLVMQVVLFFSDRYDWFWFNEFKGYSALITVAATAIALLLISAIVLASGFTKARTQFSLATLLLVIPVVAIPCGWFANEIGEARRYRSLFDSNGVGAGYEPDYVDRPLVRWLERRLGMEYFRDVTSLDIRQPDPAVLKELERLGQLEFLRLEGDQFTDDDLAYVAQCSRLKYLYIAKTPITDAGMLHLRRLRELEYVDLSGTKITDTGLAELKDSTELRELNLNETRITGAGLEHLKGLPQLVALYLNGTKLGDSGLAQIEGLTQLRYLCLNETAVSDAGLIHLKGLPLTHLFLSSTQIGDSGLAHLADHTELTYLQLSNAKVTDAGLENLTGLKKLEYLVIDQNDLSSEAKESLPKSLPPLCKIYW